MIVFPSRPDNGCGKLTIPEELDFESFEKSSEDEFVRLIMEYMSKPVRGGNHG